MKSHLVFNSVIESEDLRWHCRALKLIWEDARKKSCFKYGHRKLETLFVCHMDQADEVRPLS